jgi:hypothetical protein
MATLIYIAAFLTVAIAITHSVLGERHILIRLFRKTNLPAFVRSTLRFAWHITSIAWCGFGVILVLLARGDVHGETLRWVIGATFATSAVVALAASRGRHLSWLVFGLIAGLTVLY